MKAIVVVLLAVVVQTYCVITGLQTFTCDFTVTASTYNRGFFSGQLYYDWTQAAFLLTFPVADEYSELYIFNSGLGYNTNSLNGQFSGQYKYRNSSICFCETTTLLSSMPLFYLDDSTTTVNGNTIWVNDNSGTSSPLTYNGKTCKGYVVNPNASPNNQLVNYFWQTDDAIPCGFAFVDGRNFTFTNVKSSSVQPIPNGRFNPPVDCKCGKPIDIVISLDRTGSIQNWEWVIQHNFTLNLCNAFDYGPLKTNLGIVDWNSNFWITLGITTGVSADVVLKTVEAMTCCVISSNPYASCCCCGTPIGGGLYYAGQMMLTSNRPTATKVIILLTDGCQNHMYDPSTNPPTVTPCVCSGSTEQSCETDVQCIADIQTHYQEVTAAIPGIKIIAVGVGNDQQICQAQLDEVAGGIMSNVFNPTSWADLSNLVQSISSTACDVEDKACTGCCGICSCGSCIKPINCTAPDLCSIAEVDPISNCCTTAQAICPKRPCFIESCNPQVGCVYTPITCPAGTNCTSWSCDMANSSATYGQCVLGPNLCPAKPQCVKNSDCNDNNACTNDICTASQNCTWTPVNCGTTDNCTTYSCDIIKGCSNTTKNCNDLNLCTKDSCVGDVAGGCVFQEIQCNVSLNSCYLSKCSPSVGCYNELRPCNLSTGNCTVVGCVNGTCGRVNICVPPPPPAGQEAPIVIVGATIGAAALAGIIVGAIAIIAGLAGGGAAAYASAGAGAGATALFNNPLYHDTGHKGVSPLYKPC